jgi:WXG100 family type VII secretion target
VANEPGPGNETTTDTGLMETTARNFETEADGLLEFLKGLMNRVEDLKPYWMGRSGTAYQTVMFTWSENQDAINRELVETAGLIRTSGTNYGNTEDTATSNITGQAGTLPLPL